MKRFPEFALMILVAIWRSHHADGYALAYTKSSGNRNGLIDGCHHNGTIFGEGSMVPTVEPCLQCKCRDRNLVCSLRICGEQPVPPPRGCVLVQKRGICCSYITCSKLHVLNAVAQRRRGDAHTITRRRSPAIMGDDESRNSANALYRGIESEAPELVEGNAEMCVHNGTIYKSGSAMTTSTLCSYCYCIAGRQHCVQPKCVLASAGCSPVYSDSACCPIRYDCGSKFIHSPGKPIYEHHSNKHYMRTKSRTRRSRGCLVGTHFYPEGHKLNVDPARPCDMCFCIRGARKCTPKKCAPAISNCKAIIPEGQCCPSSYECDHTAKHPNKSRQFDIFSLIFGDEFDNRTSSNTDALNKSTPNADFHTLQSTSESTAAGDSILDAIAAGLNYINTNYSENDTLPDKRFTNKPNHISAGSNSNHLAPNISTTTEKEFSFLDIFLEDDDDDDGFNISSTNGTSPIHVALESTIDALTTRSTVIENAPDTTEGGSTQTDPIAYTTTTLTEDFSTPESIPTTDFDFSTITTEVTISDESTFASTTVIQSSNILDETTFIMDTTSETNSVPFIERVVQPTAVPTQQPSSTNTYAQDLQELLSHNPKHNTTAHKTTTENIFSALFGGISNIFGETNETTGNLNKYKIRINSQTKESINRSTILPIRRTTMKPTTMLDKTSFSSTTSMPIVLNSNPSILEADLNLDYGEPTLPPSLPNLNIIPFLPTDAVKTNQHIANIPYFNINSTLYPSAALQTNPEQLNLVLQNDDTSATLTDFGLFQIESKNAGESNKDLLYPPEDGYNRNSYPSITEPNVADDDRNAGLYGTFSEYGNIYDNFDPYRHNMQQVNDYNPIKSSALDTFSPPSETEGGFLPKEHLSDPYFSDNFHVTKPLLDTSTEHPHNKDMVHVGTLFSTETHTIRNHIPSTLPSKVAPSKENSEVHIISITTDSNYNSKVEYQEDHTTHSPNSLPNASTTESANLFGDFFDLLFRGNHEPLEVPVTIPPFRNISSLVSLDDLFNTTSKRATQNSEVSRETVTTSTEHTVDVKEIPNTETITALNAYTDSPNLEILRNALLSSLSNTDVKLSPPIPRPIYKTSVPVIRPIAPNNSEADNPQRNMLNENNPENLDLNDILDNLPVQVSQPQQPMISRRQDYVVNPTSQPLQRYEGGPAMIFTKPAPPSMGLLKLAGCNIYGRMYRVGRIISELSSDCLECKCTEVGVHCTPLDC